MKVELLTFLRLSFKLLNIMVVGRLRLKDLGNLLSFRLFVFLSVVIDRIFHFLSPPTPSS